MTTAIKKRLIKLNYPVDLTTKITGGLDENAQRQEKQRRRELLKSHYSITGESADDYRELVDQMARDLILGFQIDKRFTGHPQTNPPGTWLPDEILTRAVDQLKLDLQQRREKSSTAAACGVLRSKNKRWNRLSSPKTLAKLYREARNRLRTKVRGLPAHREALRKMHSFRDLYEMISVTKQLRREWLSGHSVRSYAAHPS